MTVGSKTQLIKGDATGGNFLISAILFSLVKWLGYHDSFELWVTEWILKQW